MVCNIFYSDKFLEHSLGTGHPESPERLRVIIDMIEKELPKACRIIEPKNINENELYIIHDNQYINKLKDLSSVSAHFSDNVFSENTFDIAKLAAAAAKEAALNCEKEFSVALARPPGHHAGINSFGGFCYLNNIAFAVRSLQIRSLQIRSLQIRSLQMNKGKGKESEKESEKPKVMIIDFDHHCGQGTEEIFYNDPSVFYLSFHCDPRIAYPGTGFESQNNEHIINKPLPSNIDDDEYIEIFNKYVNNSFNRFNPDFIAVSVGFDIYYLDPIAGLGIKEIETFRKIGEIIKKLNKPTFAVLEGGYYLPKLGEMAKNFISAFI